MIDLCKSNNITFTFENTNNATNSMNFNDVQSLQNFLEVQNNSTFNETVVQP
jgi:hypothetical protein